MTIVSMLSGIAPNYEFEKHSVKAKSPGTRLAPVLSEGTASVMNLHLLDHLVDASVRTAPPESLGICTRTYIMPSEPSLRRCLSSVFPRKNGPLNR